MKKVYENPVLTVRGFAAENVVTVVSDTNVKAAGTYSGQTEAALKDKFSVTTVDVSSVF